MVAERTVHGGVASTLLDSCMSCAIQTRVDKGLGYTTLELKVNLVRPITAKSGLIRAEGRTLYMGRRSATAEGKIVDAASKRDLDPYVDTVGRGTLLATKPEPGPIAKEEQIDPIGLNGTTTCMIFEI